MGNNLTGDCRFGYKGKNYFCPIISVQQIINMLENKYTFEQLATQVTRCLVNILCFIAKFEFYRDLFLDFK